MDKRKIQAFTLVELIVVLIILTILGTISFISFQGYSTQARDSTRISDMGTMRISLELFHLKSGKYPQPTNGINITYSGAVVWNQGVFGKTVHTNVDTLNNILIDPLTKGEYTYSITSTNSYYQLGGIMEGDMISYSATLPHHYQGELGNNRGYSEVVLSGELAKKVNAGEVTATAYIIGNYNGQVVKSITGTTCNLLAIPTIITNDTSVTDLQQIINIGNLVYKGYKNLPSSFKGSKFKYNGGFAFTPNNLLSYSDNGRCYPLIDKTTHTARVNLLKGLQDSYSGTILKNGTKIKKILDLDINTSSPSNEVINYSVNIVNSNLGGNISIDVSDN